MMGFYFTSLASLTLLWPKSHHVTKTCTSVLLNSLILDPDMIEFDSCKSNQLDSLMAYTLIMSFKISLFFLFPIWQMDFVNHKCCNYMEQWLLVSLHA